MSHEFSGVHPDSQASLSFKTKTVLRPVKDPFEVTRFIKVIVPRKLRRGQVPPEPLKPPWEADLLPERAPNAQRPTNLSRWNTDAPLVEGEKD